MRRLLRNLVEVLDGVPAVNGDRRRGQSVLELALVTPLLIVLLMGLVEIGWFANNYLILLEVTRVGARFGTVQTGSTSPLFWNNDGSQVPSFLAPALFPPDAVRDQFRTQLRDCSLVANPQNQRLQGFYNLLACVMLRSMDPLRFRGDNGVDDIVVSAFALQLIDPNQLPASMRPRLALSMVPGLDPNLPQVLVVGRYPTNANECTVNTDGSGREWERDPFDYIQDGVRTYIVPAGLPDVEENRIYLELLGFDPFNASNSNTFERQKGFSWAGQHTIGATNNRCLGSEWMIADVQRLMNVPGFSLQPDQRSKLPSMGMVLVEMFWQHQLLLRNPVFNPVFTILGDQTTISVWAAFPVPAIEPRIRFN